MDWYNTLIKPELAPPDWIFLPVWTVLYFTIAISFYFFVREDTVRKKMLPLILFCLQLGLNFLWPYLFFGMKNIPLAFLIIMLLLLFLFLTIVFFYKISKISAYFLIPYLLWVIFAAYLNFEYWRLNINL